MFNSSWTLIFIMSLLFSTAAKVINDIAWPWQDGWSLLRQRDHNVVGLVFGDLWPGIIFILSFVYYTKMAEAHQRDVRDDQDRQQGQQACLVLPNVTVLISFFLTEDNKKIFIHIRLLLLSCVRFLWRAIFSGWIVKTTNKALLWTLFFKMWL